MSRYGGPELPDPREWEDVALSCVVRACGDDPVKLRAALDSFPDAQTMSPEMEKLAKGIAARLESIKPSLPGMQR